MTQDNGHYRAYVEKNLGAGRLEQIGRANAIIAEYDAQGLDLTIRQLYYQFVARGFIENSDKSYKNLGNAINDGRMCGLVSWTAIEDRTRNLLGYRTFDSPQKAIKALGTEGDLWQYRRDLWEDQDWRPEVWIEKEALVGVVAGICNQLRVDFFACRGYNSQSEQWRAGRRFAQYQNKGQRPIVFHLGDHDPSGIDMTRDNAERLSLFAGTPISVQRLALNMDQVEEMGPGLPPNPAKMTDPRAGDEDTPGSYVYRFGRTSWELDALDPRYIRDMIDGAVGRLRDQERWDDALGREAMERQRLIDTAEEFR